METPTKSPKPHILVIPADRCSTGLAEQLARLARRYSADAVIVVESHKIPCFSIDELTHLIVSKMREQGVRGSLSDVKLSALTPPPAIALSDLAIHVPKLDPDIFRKPPPPWKERRHWRGQ